MVPEDENKSEKYPSQDKTIKEEESGIRLWGVVLFGLIGATTATLCAVQVRRTFDQLSAQLSRLEIFSSWREAVCSSIKEEARKRYNRRMQEEYEEEMERVERIRRMQSVFNRERNKYRAAYESWSHGSPGSFHYQQFQRDDWSWKTDTSHKDRRTNFKTPRRESGNYSLSHHYSVLGLDRFRTASYSDAEIKTAFRSKAMQYHPDQNPCNKEAAEAKFKELVMSYEAIKSERKNGMP